MKLYLSSSQRVNEQRRMKASRQIIRTELTRKDAEDRAPWLYAHERENETVLMSFNASWFGCYARKLNVWWNKRAENLV